MGWLGRAVKRLWAGTRALPPAFWAMPLTVLAAVPATVAVVFVLWPDLRPDPGDRIAAKMRVMTLDPSVSKDDYLAYLNRVPPSSPDKKSAPTIGVVAYVRIEIQGRKHRHLVLRYAVYRARSRERIRAGSAPPIVSGQADTPNDRWIARAWIPDPHVTGPVFARLELFDGDDVLAFADTKSFDFPEEPLRAP